MLPTDIIKKVDGDLRRALNDVEDASKTLKVLRTWIVKELLLIKERAKNNNAVTLTNDLEIFIVQLNDTAKQVHDASIKNDINSLIRNIELFIMEYRRMALSFDNVKQRLESFELSVVNTLGKTLFRDLEKREYHLNNIFAQLSREQI